jgi:hypothetical protein
MDNFFVPYTGKKPASVSINGHRLVILTNDRDMLEEDMELLGADHIKKVRLSSSKDAQQKFIGKIARQVDGGVVIAPSGVELKEVLRNLEDELPWVH